MRGGPTGTLVTCTSCLTSRREGVEPQAGRKDWWDLPPAVTGPSDTRAWTRGVGCIGRGTRVLSGTTPESPFRGHFWPSEIFVVTPTTAQKKKKNYVLPDLSLNVFDESSFLTPSQVVVRSTGRFGFVRCLPWVFVCQTEVTRFVRLRQAPTQWSGWGVGGCVSAQTTPVCPLSLSRNDPLTHRH